MKIMHHSVPNILNVTSSMLMLLFVHFIWKLSCKLPGTLKFTIMQTFDKNFVLFTEWCHVDRQCEAWLSKFALFFDVRFERLKSWQKQTYTKTEACKLYSRVFWIFLPNVIKIDLYNFELHRFKLGAFFLIHSVVCAYYSTHNHLNGYLSHLTGLANVP